MCFCWSIFGQQLIFVVGIFHTKTPTHSFDQKPAPHPKQILSVLTFENYNKVHSVLLQILIQFRFVKETIKYSFIVSLETWFFHFFTTVCIKLSRPSFVELTRKKWLYETNFQQQKNMYILIPIMFHETMTAILIFFFTFADKCQYQNSCGSSSPSLCCSSKSDDRGQW